jgi:predicted MFS family arabinose efflux permease
MSPQIAHEHDANARQAPRWGAIFALTLCVATLLASEVMPISLLTPIAHDLRITEGQAGQAIAISGIFAVLTSLSRSPISNVGINREVRWLQHGPV